MRVLSIGSIYPPHLLGGYEVIWAGVNHALARHGHSVRVLCSDFRRGDVSTVAPEDPDVHRELRWYWREHAWPRFSWRERARLERDNAAVLRRHLEQFRPDVVTFWPMGGMSLSLITQVQRAGPAAVCFLLDPWTVYGPERDAWLRGWSRPGLRQLRGMGERISGLPTRVDLNQGEWVFCSEWMRGASGLSPLGRQHVLTPGIEARYLGPPAPARPWSGKLLYLGRVVEQKGVLTAVEALAELPGATLDIAGDGDEAYRGELLRRAGELGVSARVTFSAAVDRASTPAAYANADVVLHPVRWGEPWGLVPLEAMGVGRPVIATGQGGSADYLRDGVNCLLHPPEDAPALATAVRRLADDPPLRADLVAGGLLTARAHPASAFEAGAVAVIAAAA